MGPHGDSQPAFYDPLWVPFLLQPSHLKHVCQSCAQGSGVSGWQPPQSGAAEELGTPKPCLPKPVPSKKWAACKQRTVVTESLEQDSAAWGLTLPASLGGSPRWGAWFPRAEPGKAQQRVPGLSGPCWRRHTPRGLPLIYGPWAPVDTLFHTDPSGGIFSSTSASAKAAGQPPRLISAPATVHPSPQPPTSSQMAQATRAPRSRCPAAR